MFGVQRRMAQSLMDYLPKEDDFGPALSAAAYDAQAQGNGSSVWIPAGTWSIKSSVDLPMGVRLWFDLGGTLNLESGVTLSVEGPILASDHPIFTGLGTVVLSAAAGEVNPIWWGADRTGTIDSSPAFAACTSCASAAKLPIRIPSGSYLLSQTWVLNANIPMTKNDGAQISASGAADGIQFSAGNYARSTYHLPTIVGFSGAGLHFLPGSNLVHARLGNIADCGDGILLETNATETSTLDNWVEFEAINTCTNGVHMKCTDSNQVQQGNVIRGNFITGVTNGLYFDTPAGTSPNWNINIFQIDAIDCGQVANSRGIYGPNGIPPACVFSIRSFLGGFTISAVEGTSNESIYQVNIQTTINNWWKLSGEGNVVQNYGQPWQGVLTAAPIQAVTASGDQAGFNGAKLLTANRTFIGLPVPALAAGATADFYVYHAFTQGYSNQVQLVPMFSQPIAVLAVEDESIQPGVDGNTSANQIHIRVIALAATIAQTVNCVLTVGL